MREEVDVDGQLIKTFVKLPTSIEASLPEQIGVEFLLRDISDSSKSSVTKIANDKLMSIKALIQRLTEIKTYLNNVINKRIVLNPVIVNNIQEIFNYLPNFDTDDIIKSLSNQTNNNYLVLYLGWLVKSIVSLHKLINNKIMLKEEEKIPVKKEEEKETPKETK
jgi:26S proteasome regulatory subunit N8